MLLFFFFFFLLLRRNRYREKQHAQEGKAYKAERGRKRKEFSTFLLYFLREYSLLFLPTRSMTRKSILFFSFVIPMMRISPWKSRKHRAHRELIRRKRIRSRALPPKKESRSMHAENKTSLLLFSFSSLSFFCIPLSTPFPFLHFFVLLYSDNMRQMKKLSASKKLKRMQTKISLSLFLHPPSLYTASCCDRGDDIGRKIV